MLDVVELTRTMFVNGIEYIRTDGDVYILRAGMRVRWYTNDIRPICRLNCHPSGTVVSGEIDLSLVSEMGLNVSTLLLNMEVTKQCGSILHLEYRD